MCHTCFLHNHAYLCIVMHMHSYASACILMHAVVRQDPKHPRPPPLSPAPDTGTRQQGNRQHGNRQQGPLAPPMRARSYIYTGRAVFFVRFWRRTRQTANYGHTADL